MAPSGNYELVQLLLENGANVNARDTEVRTALAVTKPWT
jgi:ankyrin repeat protein